MGMHPTGNFLATIAEMALATPRINAATSPRRQTQICQLVLLGQRVVVRSGTVSRSQARQTSSAIFQVADRATVATTPVLSLIGGIAGMALCFQRTSGKRSAASPHPSTGVLIQNAQMSSAVTSATKKNRSSVLCPSSPMLGIA